MIHHIHTYITDISEPE